MTVEVYPGPGTNSWRSTLYTATVEGVAAYVYGNERTSIADTCAWVSGTNVNVSVLVFGGDQTADVRVSRIAGPITSAIVYPKDKGVGQDITGGVLRLSIPTNVRVHVEINGNRKDVLVIAASPLKSAVPAVKTDWSAVPRLVVESITLGSGLIQTSTPHGYATNSMMRFETSGTLPVLTSGASVQFDNFFVTSIAANQFKISRTQGGPFETFVSAGTGTVSTVAAQWTNTGSALYFPPGLHTIGRQFKVASDTTIYIDGGAVVTGSFSLKGTDRAVFRGPGVISGKYALPEVVVANTVDFYADFVPYCTFTGYDGSKFLFDNSVAELTIIACPAYNSFIGISSWTNVQIIQPWWYGCNGLEVVGRTSADRSARIIDCYVYSCDDNLVLGEYVSGIDLTVRNTFSVSVLNSCYHLNYWPQPNLGKFTLFDDCDAMHLGIADMEISGPVTIGGNTIFKAWSDGTTGQSAYGRFNVSFINQKVWGPLPSRIFAIENKLYPWGASGQQLGNNAFWTIDGLDVEQVPGQVSRIVGKDYDNTGHDLMFQGFTIAGVPITAQNWSTYVYMFKAYNIIVGGQLVAPSPQSMIAKWVNMTGRRLTSGSDVLPLIVDAYASTNPQAEWGISRVVFTLTDSLGVVTSVTSYDREWRFPIYSPYTTSKLPNAYAGAMAPVYGYGVSYLASQLSVGEIRVDAVAWANNGAQLPLPSITVYNDRTGDTRPSNKVIYVNPTTGNDANPGTIGSKMRTIQAAILKARKNPATAGTVMADADCGGARIVLDDGIYAGFGNTNYSNSQISWHTSGDWWLQIESPGGGAIIRRVYDANKYDALYPDSYLFAPGWRPTGSTQPFVGSCRVQISNCVFEDIGPAVSIGNGGTPNAIDFHCWVDGGESYTTVSRNSDYSVLYSAGFSGQLISVDYGHGNLYCSGHYRHHHAEGWYGWTHVIDCVLEHYTAIAFQSASGIGTYAVNCLIDGQQAYNGNGSGLATDGYVWVVDGAKLSVSVPGPGLMRVDSTAALTSAGFGSGVTTSFGPEFQYIAAANATTGNYIMGVGFKNFSNPGNNGVFVLQSAGVNPNGTHYVICYNPQAVPQSGVTTGSLFSTTQLFTGRVYPQPLQFNEVVHPDIMQWNSDMSDTLFSSIMVRNIRESQGFYMGGHRLTNCWMVNVADGGLAPTNNFSSLQAPPGGLTNCGFVNCTFTGGVDFTGSTGFVGNSFTNVVFARTTAAPTHGTAITSNYYDSCHWIVQPPTFGADAARGVSPSTGVWFEYDPAIPSFLLTPTYSNQGTGNPIAPQPLEAEWLERPGSTRGVWLNIGTFDALNIPPPGSGTPATGSGALQSLSMAMLAPKFGRGVLAGVQSLTLTQLAATADVSNQVTANAAVLSMTLGQLTATAVVPRFVTNSNPLPLTLTQFNQLASIPESVTGAVLSLTLTQLAASFKKSTSGQNITEPMTLVQLQQSASVFTPPVLAVQNLSLGILAATAKVERVARNTVISTTLTAVQQPQTNVATYVTVPSLSLSVLPAVAVGGIRGTNTPIALSLGQLAPTFGRGVLQQPIAASVAVPVQYGVTEVRVPVSTLGMILTQTDLYQSNPATVVASSLPMRLFTVTQQATIQATVEVFGLNTFLAQPAATASVAATATNTPILLRLQIMPAESAGSANVVVSKQSLNLTVLQQGATAGTQAYANTLSLLISQPVAQVGTAGSGRNLLSNLQLIAYNQTVSIPANVTLAVQSLSISAPSALGDTEVFARYSGAIPLSIAVGSVEGFGFTTIPPQAEISKGTSRENINKDLPAVPVPKEEWRIIQVLL